VTDRHRAARQRLEDAVLRGPGQTRPELRQGLAANKDVPPELTALVEKIRRHPYKVTDEDVAALRGRYSEDELFEIVVASALGASIERVEAGLRALEDAE
jgi:alkylhydroperoxidase family enzyme